MCSAGAPIDSEVYHAIASGIRAAGQRHYASAAAHFARAQCGAALGNASLAAAIESFLADHGAYWHAQQALHDAGLHFSTAHSAQQRRIQAIAELLAAAAPHAAAGLLPHAPPAPAPAPEAGATDDAVSLPPLAIRCLGGFEVWRGGAPLRLCASRNGQAILRLLVSRPGHSAAAEEVMETFWPDDDPATARHKLHVAVSALRGALHAGLPCPRGGYIAHDDGVYRLGPPGAVSTDADAFLAAYEAGRAAGDGAAPHFEAACRLYRGHFLPDDRYADWPVVRREQLTQLYLQMCEALGARALAEGRPDEAVHWAGRLLAENRCDEAAHRLAISAHAAAGRRAEALRQYQRCAAALRDEMSIEPDAPTEELLRRVLGT